METPQEGLSSCDQWVMAILGLPNRFIWFTGGLEDDLTQAASILEVTGIPVSLRYWQWRDNAWHNVSRGEWRSLQRSVRGEVDALRKASSTQSRSVLRIIYPTNAIMDISPVYSLTSTGKEFAGILSNDGTRALMRVTFTWPGRDGAMEYWFKLVLRYERGRWAVHAVDPDPDIIYAL